MSLVGSSQCNTNGNYDSGVGITGYLDLICQNSRCIHYNSYIVGGIILRIEEAEVTGAISAILVVSFNQGDVAFLHSQHLPCACLALFLLLKLLTFLSNMGFLYSQARTLSLV